MKSNLIISLIFIIFLFIISAYYYICSSLFHLISICYWLEFILIILGLLGFISWVVITCYGIRKIHRKDVMFRSNTFTINDEYEALKDNSDNDDDDDINEDIDDILSYSTTNTTQAISEKNLEEDSCCGPRTKCRRICAYITVAIIVIVNILIIVLFSIILYINRNTLPQVDGIITGLNRNITIIREKPSYMVHIEANNLNDVFYGQGYSAAQDRLWQIEFQRRVGSGTLSELVGNGAIDIDKFARIMGIKQAAAAAIQYIDQDTMNMLTNYVAGINDYIQHHANLPIEFHIFNYKKIKPYTITDVLVWIKMMSYILSMNMDKELERYDMYINMNISLARIEQLIPQYNDQRFPLIIDTWPPNSNITSSSSDNTKKKKIQQQPLSDIKHILQEKYHTLDTTHLLNKIVEPFRNIFGGGSYDNSNNWVVSGDITDTGLPYLNNDPHLTLSSSSVWYMQHLTTPTLNIIGASLPGIPTIVIGHNNHIAWGVTNSGADVQDLYIMQEDQINHPNQYFYQNTWHNYTIRNEEIKIANQASLMIQVRQSIYGPVISDLVQFNSHAQVPNLCLRWVSLDEKDTSIISFYKLQFATNYTEFKQALSYFIAPAQNFIYADQQNNIAYQLPGKIPIRHTDHDGKYPIIGNGTYDWISYIPYSQLPYILNPKNKFIASANNKIISESLYNYTITNDWFENGYRALRISNVLSNKLKYPLTKNKLITLQNDNYSILLQDLYSILLRNLNQMYLNKKAEIIQKELLSQANFHMNLSIQSNTVLQIWYRYLTTLPAKEVLQSHWDYPHYILNALNSSSHDPNCNITEYIISSSQQDNDAIKEQEFTMNNNNNPCIIFASIAFNKAVENKHSQSQWGDLSSDLHLANFQHPIFGTTILGCIFNRKIGHSGDDSTVNVGKCNKNTWQLEQTFGPSYRQIIDLSNFQQSIYINPPGNSGNLLSPYYDNHLSLWSNGTYYPLYSNKLNYTSNNDYYLLQIK